MASWLASDPSNVVTIFSRAGRGRAGTLASAFLLYCRLFTAPEEAMYYFAGRRCLGGGYSLLVLDRIVCLGSIVSDSDQGLFLS